MKYGVSVTKASMITPVGILASHFPVHRVRDRFESICGKDLILVDEASIKEAKRYHRFKACRKCFPEQEKGDSE